MRRFGTKKCLCSKCVLSVCVCKCCVFFASVWDVCVYFEMLAYFKTISNRVKVNRSLAHGELAIYR